jgi:hypothetical protein
MTPPTAWNLYWGETHDNARQFPDDPARGFAVAMDRAAAHLDFYSAAYYTSFSTAFKPGGHLSELPAAERAALVLEGGKPPEQLDREWGVLQQITREKNRPGRFVAFPGYEWQGDGSSGDHNVICFAEVFEFQADPAAPLCIRMNGMEARGSVLEFAQASREMWFKDECVRLLAERAGIPPGAPEREDIYHHVAFKVKLHRPIPEAGYTAELSLDDADPLAGETHYRVRVEQRNAQRAWSTPIWATPELGT